MVEKRDCSFCGSPIEPGTGLMYVKRDGTRQQFCKAKCRRNMLDLKRVPRTVKWTKHYIKGLGKAAALQTKKGALTPAPAAAPPAAPAGEGPAAGEEKAESKKPAAAKPK